MKKINLTTAVSIPVVDMKMLRARLIVVDTPRGFHHVMNMGLKNRQISSTKIGQSL